MTGTISMAWNQFDLLASGRSDAESLRVLRAARFSKHMLLLRDVVDSAPAGVLDAALTVLKSVQQQAPAVFTASVADPHFGAWAARVLRRTRDPLWTDTAHLGAIAASAALRAGIDFEIPVRPGDIVLPCLGVTRTTTVLNQHTEIAVPVHTLSAGHELRLDDLNPYRDLPRLLVSEHLSSRTVSRWQTLFTEAWTVLPEHHADEIEGMVVALVPLVRRDSAHGLSASSPDACGSIALTEPQDSTTFAATLVHETKHSVLNTILDLVELYVPEDDTWYYSPWRTDPRPVRGLLHGTFAFLSVADFWRSQQHEKANAHFARIATQLRHALNALADAGLTDIGKRFAGTIRSTVDSWGPVTPAPDVQAQVEDHWRNWRTRHPNLVGRSAR